MVSTAAEVLSVASQDMTEMQVSGCSIPKFSPAKAEEEKRLSARADAVLRDQALRWLAASQCISGAATDSFV